MISWTVAFFLAVLAAGRLRVLHRLLQGGHEVDNLPAGRFGRLRGLGRTPSALAAMTATSASRYSSWRSSMGRPESASVRARSLHLLLRQVHVGRRSANAVGGSELVRPQHDLQAQGLPNDTEEGQPFPAAERDLHDGHLAGALQSHAQQDVRLRGGRPARRYVDRRRDQGRPTSSMRLPDLTGWSGSPHTPEEKAAHSRHVSSGSVYRSEAVGFLPLSDCFRRSTTMVVRSIRRLGTSCPGDQAYSIFAMTVPFWTLMPFPVQPMAPSGSR